MAAGSLVIDRASLRLSLWQRGVSYGYCFGTVLHADHLPSMAFRRGAPTVPDLFLSPYESNLTPLPPSLPSFSLARGPRPSGSPCAGTKIIVQECGQTFQLSEDLRSIPVTCFWIMHVRGWSRFEGVFEKGSGKNWIVERERERKRECLYRVFTI